MQAPLACARSRRGRRGLDGRCARRWGRLAAPLVNRSIFRLEFGWPGGSAALARVRDPQCTNRHLVGRRDSARERSRAVRALAPGAAPCGLPPRAASRQVPPGADGRPMEAVELPPVGMSWARAGLPALGPPPLKKGRSRQELMQREAEFQRRRGAAPAARGRRQALDPLAGSRRRPDARLARACTPTTTMGLDRRGRTARGDGADAAEPPAEPQRLAAPAGTPAHVGAQRSTKRRRAATSCGGRCPPRRRRRAGRCAPARAPSTSRAARCRPSTPSTPPAPSASRSPIWTTRASRRPCGGSRVPPSRRDLMRRSGHQPWV